MISTLSDLNVYAKKLYFGPLLKQKTQENRLKTIRLDGSPEYVQYGEGIARIGKFWGHNGTIFGFSTEMWYLPAKDAVIVINVNRLDKEDESKSTPLFLTIAKEVFPEDVVW